MAQARPKFEFDLNELPPPQEDDAAASMPTDAARDPSMPSVREPSPEDSPLLPDLDFDAPLSPLDEDEDEDDADDDPQLPAGGPLSRLSPETTEPPRGSASCDDDDKLGTTRLPDPRERSSSTRDSETTTTTSQEKSAPRAPSRGGASETTTSHRSRHYYDAPRDDAISKRRRCSGYDEGAATSHGGRSSSRSPRRHEETDGIRRFAPPTNGNKCGGQRPRGNRQRRRRRPPYANQNTGPDPRMQQHGYNHRMPVPQGFRGHQAYHSGGAHGNAPRVCSTRQDPPYHKPYSGPHSRHDAYCGRHQSQAQDDPHKAGGGYYLHTEAHDGRRRQSPVPKLVGYQQQHREAPPPLIRSPLSGAHGREGSTQEHGPNANGAYQQTKETPRGRAPVRRHHPYARGDGAFHDGASGVGNKQAARHESRPNYYHHHHQRRGDTRKVTGEPDRISRRPYYDE